MVDIKEIDLDNNNVTYSDHQSCDFEKFHKTWVEFWQRRIAGETLTHSDTERFMRRTSSKNLKLLIDCKKAEGFIEGALGKKVDPSFMKLIIIMVIAGAGIMIALIVLKNMGLI